MTLTEVSRVIGTIELGIVEEQPGVVCVSEPSLGVQGRAHTLTQALEAFLFSLQTHLWLLDDYAEKHGVHWSDLPYLPASLEPFAELVRSLPRGALDPFIKSVPHAPALQP